MKRKQYTTENIKNYLKEYLGFEWVDKLIYKVNKYVVAKASDFGKGAAMIYVKNRLDVNPRRVYLDVGNDHFIISWGSSKLDASAGWTDFIANKDNAQTL